MTYGNTYVLTVNRVRDRAVTPMVIPTNSTWSFKAAEYFLQDIGTPPAGSVTFVNGGGVDIMAGDGRVEGTNDQFNYSYQERSR